MAERTLLFMESTKLMPFSSVCFDEERVGSLHLLEDLVPSSDKRLLLFRPFALTSRSGFSKGLCPLFISLGRFSRGLNAQGIQEGTDGASL